MQEHHVLKQKGWDYEYVGVGDALAPRDQWLEECVAVRCPERRFMCEYCGPWNNLDDIGVCVVCGVVAL